MSETVASAEALPFSFFRQSENETSMLIDPETR